MYASERKDNERTRASSLDMFLLQPIKISLQKIFVFIFILSATHPGNRPSSANKAYGFPMTSSSTFLTPSQIITSSSLSRNNVHDHRDPTLSKYDDMNVNHSKRMNLSKQQGHKRRQTKQKQTRLSSQNDDFNEKPRTEPHSKVAADTPDENSKKLPHVKKYNAKLKKSDHTNSQLHLGRPKMVGNAPNIYWRAIPMKHLRLHPNFDPLPLPSEIFYLKNLTQVSQFRQDSWQWQALHMGRCTTSQTAAAMGLLEPHAAASMGVPKSLWKAGARAFDRLKEGGDGSALVDLDELNEVLFGIEEGEEESWGMEYIHFGSDGDKDDDDGGDIITYDVSATNATQNNIKNQIWDINANGAYGFAARYLPRDKCEISAEEKAAVKLKFNHSSLQVRMYWGSAQEATSILTALNYFRFHDPQLRVREIGLCVGNDLLTPQQQELLHGLQIGSSPDAVLAYSDGRLEVLEVKNHCPFVENIPNRNRNYYPKKSSSHKYQKYRIQHNDAPAIVPAGYVPQLMMEMLCLGPNCKSAIMVRQTATRGAVILRLHRDDDWINEMLSLLGRFKTEHMDKDIPPPANFFWEDEDPKRRKQYRAFVARTKQIGDEAELVTYVEHSKIQRVMPERGLSHVPLFLD